MEAPTGGRACIACRRPKATLSCGRCSEPLCRDCAQFVAADAFSFLREVPAELSLSNYCPACHDAVVAPARESYEAVMERARAVRIYFESQNKRLIRIVRRSKESVSVKDCRDRDETLLRLAFRAAEQGYDSLIDVRVTQARLRNEGYQTSLWSGTALPAEVK